MRRAAALAALTAISLAIAHPASASAAKRQRPVSFSFCRRYQHLNVGNSLGTRYTVYNDMFGSPTQCLANSNRWSNFQVAKSAAFSRNQEPQAFPDIYYGCSRGWCSPDTVLPLRVYALNRPETSWYTTDRAGGQWDVAYDLWFSRTRQISGQPNGAELMIWLNERGSRVPTYDGGRYLRIAGTSWYMDHWRPCRQRTCWNYVRFWRVHRTSQVSHLWLDPFIRSAEGKRLIERSWWLDSIAAGYEIWRNGTGLATTWFSARA